MPSIITRGAFSAKGFGLMINRVFTGLLTALGSIPATTASMFIALSFDDKNLYATTNTGLVNTYNRDAGTGLLTAGGSLPLGVPEIGRLCTSNDNTNVYALQAGNAVSNPGSLYYLFALQRNTSTGVLLSGTHVTNPSWVWPINAPRCVAISSDNNSVYVGSTELVSGSSGRLVSFSRDPSTGNLTLIGTIPMSLTVSEIAVAPDGRSVYIFMSGQSGVPSILQLFTRNTTTGVLTASTSITLANTSLNWGTPVLIGNTASAICVSPNSTSVYAVVTIDGYPGSTSATSWVYCYSRDTTTGALTATSTPIVACGLFARGACISPDNLNLYVTGSGIYMLSINIATKNITPIGSLALLVGTGYSVDITTDGTSIYAMGSASTTYAISEFKRD